MYNGLLDPELTSYTSGAGLRLTGYVNSHNDRYSCMENPNVVHEVS
jgi:hypothetical protein